MEHCKSTKMDETAITIKKSAESILFHGTMKRSCRKQRHLNLQEINFRSSKVFLPEVSFLLQINVSPLFCTAAPSLSLSETKKHLLRN